MIGDVTRLLIDTQGELSLFLGLLIALLPVNQGFAFGASSTHRRAVSVEDPIEVVEEGLEVGQGFLMVHIVLW